MFSHPNPAGNVSLSFIPLPSLQVRKDETCFGGVDKVRLG